MRNTFNRKLFILGVGILQPVKPSEVIKFLQQLFPEVSHWPSLDSLNKLITELEDKFYLHCISRKKNLFSLTDNANFNMNKKYRYFRDKVRLSLLNDVHKARIILSDVERKDLGGDSPSLNSSSTTKDGSRPERSGLESSRAEATCLQARSFWSRISEQRKDFKVGLSSLSSDTPQLSNSRSLRYYSFSTLRILQDACSGSKLKKDMTSTQLAMCIGVSPGLITSLAHKPENHYRKFKLPKKTGGVREIASPRFFLKTIQYWINDYFLWQLKIHGSCHAYLPKRSIQSNGFQHVNKNYVANIDIRNFFGSITFNHIEELLIKNGIGPTLSFVLSNLLTLNDCLPQGAPTSPTISNAFLYEFDKTISDYCIDKKLIYTRYADDITISGDSRQEIVNTISFAKKKLDNFNLQLKGKKTRIASKYASQRVTGLVVNEYVLPPRKYRRIVRAIFHNAKNSPDEYLERLEEMKGHFSFLSSFEKLKGSKELYNYKKIINSLEQLRTNTRNQ